MIMMMMMKIAELVTNITPYILTLIEKKERAAAAAERVMK
jgi:hypothetical protein